MLKVPCKDCQDRYPACHDKCERYISFRKELDKYKEEERKEKEALRNDRYYARWRH